MERQKGVDAAGIRFPAKRVFVSYSTEDRELAEAARDGLEQRGIGVWMAPRDILPGEDYGQAIINAINNSRVMVLVLSRHSDASPAVRREVERAFSKGVRLIPLMIEDFQLGTGLEFFVASPQWIKSAGMSADRMLAALVAGVQAALAAGPDGRSAQPSGGSPGNAGTVEAVAAPGRSRKTLVGSIVGGAAAVAVVAVLGSSLYRGHGTIDLVRRAEAFEAIEQGKGNEAQGLLEGLQGGGSPSDRAFATAGSAALLLLQGDAAGVPPLIDRARELSRECALCDVVEGDLLLLDGKLEPARARYRSALEQRSAAPVERAAAAAGLGRASSSQGNGEEALRYYAQALDEAPGNLRALTGRARILAGMGKYEEAIAGIRTRSTDPGLAALLRVLTREMALRRSGEQQDRVSRLVDDVVRQYRAGGRAAVPEDAWTSRPAAVCFFETSTQGGPSYLEGGDAMLLAGIQQQLQENGRFAVVEREDFDRVLQELKIATSGAADQESAVRFGRLRTATVLLYGTAVRQGARTALAFKAVSTETSEILGRVSVEVPPGPTPDISRNVAGQLLGLLGKTFPIRGRVVGVARGGLELNIGSRVGVREGMVLNVRGPDGTSGVAGTLRVVQVSETAARAEVVTAVPAVHKGDRVEATL